MGESPLLDRNFRSSICLASSKPDTIIHDGDAEFPKELNRLYTTEESVLLERLGQMKSKLRNMATDDFWSYLTEQMSDILDAQMSLVAKRILVDEQHAAVEMPPIGEPGACLMASAFHYNDGKGTTNTMKAFKYHAYGCPCGYMRHDKVFVIPDRLNSFISDNPNELPFPCDAYIGIPLFADGKCFAHFGALWSEEGAKHRKFSWAIIELFLHSLEDVILARLLEGSNFSNSDVSTHDRRGVIPHGAVTAAQSLKPYARSLSHELRTPMQGVVGMLDVMYATVLEAAEGQTDSEVRRVFETLKENIEVVQDSSRRAVEAADNVVHAYDMDMSVPEASPTLMTGESLANKAHERPEILVEGSGLPVIRPNKRRRGADDSAASSTKIHATHAAWASRGEPSEGLVSGRHESELLPDHAGTKTPPNAVEIEADLAMSPTKLSPERNVAPGLRHTQLRNVLQYVVNEGLKVGGRPESAIARETETGEIIEVTTRNPIGEPRTKLVEWSVHPDVPVAMFVDEKDMGKLISCVFLNAVKFTDQGNINVAARMSSHSRHIVIKISDTGPGIPAAFLPKLFKPFSQEDASLTRQSEGLGLGLLVAKGIARKLGGDIMCTRAQTGEHHGSEFEMRIPVTPGERVSRPASPFNSPAPRRSQLPPFAEAEHQRLMTPTQLQKCDSPPVRPSDNASISEAETSRAHSAVAPGINPPSLTAPVTDRTFRSPIPPIPSPSSNSMALPPVVRRQVGRKASANMLDIDRDLAGKYPLTFLVAEDNKINRKLLVSMLNKFGYKTVHEAYDGADAVRQMEKHKSVDVILMDLWMPYMDGYEATERILAMSAESRSSSETSSGIDGADGTSKLGPTVLAVTADVTDGALERAAKVGMKGFMTKPFKLLDLQRLIMEYCTLPTGNSEA